MVDIDELERNLLSFKNARRGDLTAELGRARGLNLVLESVIESLEVTNQDVKAIVESSQDANALLDKWNQLISQTEHTQRLLSDENWQGLTKDDEILEQHRRERARLQEIQQRKEAEEKQKAINLARQTAKPSSSRDAARRHMYGGRVAAPGPTSSRATTPRVTRSQSRVSKSGTAHSRKSASQHNDRIPGKR